MTKDQCRDPETFTRCFLDRLKKQNMSVVGLNVGLGLVTRSVQTAVLDRKVTEWSCRSHALLVLNLCK